jgi:two-component system nitrogen regulation response regulator NtrX
MNHFIQLAADTYGHKPRRVNAEVLGIFNQYPWPGNIRELRNIVERMMIMTRGGEELTVADVPPAILNAVNLNGAGAKAVRPEGALPADLTSLGNSYREAKENFERAYLTAQLTKHNWNISKTAEVIRLERSNLHKKIRQLNIQAE